MFDYFAILVSIILGLALTHLLRGLAKLLQQRQQVRNFVPHVWWALNVVQFVLTIWWGMFWWRGLTDWTYEWFLYISGYAILLFVWSYMLFPQEFPEHMDFEAFYFDNRKAFFGLMLATAFMDVPETLLKAHWGLRDAPADYPLILATMIAVSLAGLLTRRRSVHLVLPAVWFVVQNAYIGLTSLHRIAGALR